MPDACVMCGRGLTAATTKSGCCSGKCRAEKSRRAADDRRRRDLTEVLSQLDGLRLRVEILRDGGEARS